jgi:Uma2 family endonuclease
MTVAEATAAPRDEVAELDVPKGFELLDGNLVELKMGTQSSYIAGQLHGRVDQHVKAAHLGWALPSDVTYQCFPDRPLHLRRPDVSFVRFGRYPGEVLPAGNTRFAPDWLAEVVSPNDLYSDVEEKVIEFLDAGTLLIWIVDPPTQSVRVVRRDGSSALLRRDDMLDGENVLPGFHCRVADLFPSAATRNGAA